MGRNWGSRWLALSLLGSASVANADQICADRPGKASATCTEPDGHLQLEVGLVDWLQHGSSLTIFSTAIKYGVTKRSHVEIDIAPLTRADDEWGFGDVVARYKHQLTNEGSAIAVTAYPFVKIPTAKSPIGNGKVDGDSISFSVTSNFNGNEFKLNYSGKVSGSEMKLVMSVEGRDRTFEMTAKKAS